jgi:hypothetical protein
MGIFLISKCALHEVVTTAWGHSLEEALMSEHAAMPHSLERSTMSPTNFAARLRILWAGPRRYECGNLLRLQRLAVEPASPARYCHRGEISGSPASWLNS